MKHSNPHIGVILAQLGTPDEPTTGGLRAYLGPFLSDRRVIDYNPLLWQPVLHGVILRVRPRRSARLYQHIWREDGSPLLVYTLRQVAGLQERLGDEYQIIPGMTYGSHGIRGAMGTLEAQGIGRILVLPMFPQYSSTTTAAVYDAVYAAAAGRRGERKRFVPALRFIEPYYDDAEYIEAMAAHLRDIAAGLNESPDKFVITFHGIPSRFVRTGDPYRSQCEITAQRLADSMGWRDDEWVLCFQSRFGTEAWLEPYTNQVLEDLAHRGVKRPLVFSPGFTTDCLETLDELGNEGRAFFEKGGGCADNYHLASCLNDKPLWLDVLAQMIRKHAQGWTESREFTVEGLAPQTSKP